MTRIKAAFVTLLLTVYSSALADKVDDFRDAVSKRGCDSIPYNDLRNNCRSQQSDVHPWCDGARGPVTCGTSAEGLKRQLRTAEGERDKLKEKLRDQEDQRSRATDESEKAKLKSEIESTEKEIDAARKKVEDLKNDIGKRKDHVEKAIYTLGKCIDYRRAVMNVFAYATDKVRGESDPDVRPHALQLRDSYATEISGHDEQIKNRTNSIENCKKEMP
jgi:flagellar motility protein MotE (MotC chaperone)